MSKAQRRRRRAHADGITEPTSERWERREVERVPGQILDEAGAIARPFRSIDTLMLLERNGSINRGMYDAGVRFRDDFTVASLESLRAAAVDRIPGCGQIGDLTNAQMAARRRIWTAVVMLGGFASPAGNCAWKILGLGKSIGEWAQSEGWNGRRIGEKTASGVLIAALGALKEHYGI